MRWRAAAWSSLIAATLLLASLFNAGVTNGTRSVRDTSGADVLPSESILDTRYVHSGTHKDASRNVYAVAAGVDDDVGAGVVADPSAADCVARLSDVPSRWVPRYSRCTDDLP
jgi:hypothetical protein